jgi:hypothetical protein
MSVLVAVVVVVVAEAEEVVVVAIVVFSDRVVEVVSLEKQFDKVVATHGLDSDAEEEFFVEEKVC